MRALLLIAWLGVTSVGVASIGIAQDAGGDDPRQGTGSSGAAPGAGAEEPPDPRAQQTPASPSPEAGAEEPPGPRAQQTPENPSPEAGADTTEPGDETATDADSDIDSFVGTHPEPHTRGSEPGAPARNVDSEARSTNPDEHVPTRVERHTETRFVPMAGSSDPDPISAEIEALSGLFGSDRSLSALGLLLLVVLFAALAAVALRRGRERLEPTGLLPTLLALLHLALRLVAVACALALLVRVLPPRTSLVMLLALGGLAIAIGWSSRDVLPDLVAGFVLVFERRVRGGMWLVGDGFAGQVRRVGIRSTLLIDVMGRQVDVPNRHLVRAPLTSDACGEQEHEVLVRFESEAPAEQIRAALRDAVLASPWVLPGTAGVVLRDPDQPSLWRVRAHLLDPTLVSRFEGDLLERAEEILASFEASGRTPHDESRPRTSRNGGEAL